MTQQTTADKKRGRRPGAGATNEVRIDARHLRKFAIREVLTLIRQIRRVTSYARLRESAAAGGLRTFGEIDKMLDLGQTLKSLPPHEAKLLLHYHGDGYTITECATVMGVSSRWVSTVLNAAYRSLVRAAA